MIHFGRVPGISKKWETDEVGRTPLYQISDALMEFAIKEQMMSDFSVVVAVGGEVTLQQLQYDPYEDEYHWVNDWWKDEKLADVYEISTVD